MVPQLHNNLIVTLGPV